MQTEDLIKYGLIPELVGRFSVMGVLNELSKEQLYRILVAPKDAITKQYKALFQMDGVELEFSQRSPGENHRIRHCPRRGGAWIARHF